MAKTDREAGDVELVESAGTDSIPSTVHVHPITSESTLVPAKYMGTQQDKREMFTMGRAQQLRVSNSLLPPPASSLPSVTSGYSISLKSRATSANRLSLVCRRPEEL